MFMKDYERVDISSVKNQNELAIQAANYFSIEDLEKINLESITLLNKREVTDKFNTLYQVTLENDLVFQIIDVLFIEKYPVERFTYLRFKKDNEVKLDIKCRQHKSNIEFINLILSKAKNFKMHSNENDEFIVMRNLINNFSKKISNIISLETLTEIKQVTSFLSDELAILDHPEEKTHSVHSKECTVALDIILNTFKFTVTNTETEESYYMYFMFNKIGLSSIHLCIEKALQYKRRNNKSRGV